MDINMNNAQFVKENENGPGWIYLSKDGKSKDIKVFYDDGTFDNNYHGDDSLKTYYSDYMQTLNDLNGITVLDNAGQVMDFAVTLAQIFGDKLEGITGATPTGTQIEYLKNYIYSKLTENQGFINFSFYIL